MLENPVGFFASSDVRGGFEVLFRSYKTTVYSWVSIDLILHSVDELVLCDLEHVWELLRIQHVATWVSG